MANDQEATDTVYYSWDEGMTWESYKFTETPFEVENIIIEPSNTGQHFIIYGDIIDKKQGKKVGHIVTLDFSGLH